MPCPVPSLLPRQPRLSPDPSGDVPAGPSHRATRSSCDSQPQLRSARTPRVPPGHPARLRPPDATPAPGPRLLVSDREAPASTGILMWGCAHGRVRMHKPPTRCYPLLQKLPPTSGRPRCPGCPQCYPGLADAIVPQVRPRGSFQRGVAQCGTAA